MALYNLFDGNWYSRSWIVHQQLPADEKAGSPFQKPIRMGGADVEVILHDLANFALMTLASFLKSSVLPLKASG